MKRTFPHERNLGAAFELGRRPVYDGRKLAVPATPNPQGIPKICIGTVRHRQVLTDELHSMSHSL